MAYITISTNFMKSHPKAGQATDFETKIIDGEKIHTIRANPKHWVPKITKCAYFDIRKWLGAAYRSKMQDVLRLTRKDGLGFEYIRFIQGDIIVSNGTKHKKISVEQLAKNDGLSVEDFKNWFKEYKTGETMIIIHFTSFRYCD